jgi:hypothetical protein
LDNRDCWSDKLVALGITREVLRLVVSGVAHLTKHIAKGFVAWDNLRLNGTSQLLQERGWFAQLKVSLIVSGHED